jgi:hypothetical protein
LSPIDWQKSAAGASTIFIAQFRSEPVRSKAILHFRAEILH